MNKKGWMLIMEATVAVLIITGVLIAVYSQQVDRRVDPVEYYNSLQGQILADVSSNSSLRLNVLNVVKEDSSDSNFVALDNFIGSKIPDGFAYHIRVCNFSELVCKMANSVFITTMDKDIYVEEIIVSAEIGEGTNAVYSPKRLRLFVWEGEDVGVGCNDECPHVGTIYYCDEDDNSKVLNRSCASDSDGCLIWDGAESLSMNCPAGKTCVEGENRCEGCTNDCSNVGDIEKICDGSVVVKKECEEVSGCLKLKEISRTDCSANLDGKTICSNGVCVESGTGTQDNPFIVHNLKADVWFASQGDGDSYMSGGIPVETKPYIKLNGNKVGESGIYGVIFEGIVTLKKGKNLVELYSNWEDKDKCEKIRGDEGDGYFIADAVVAVLRLNSSDTVQTDSSWEQQDRTVGNWTSPPAVVYSDFPDGGCNMGSAMPMNPAIYWRAINNPWTDKEMCINSHACRDNCCVINVKKEFWVSCEDINWAPSLSDYCPSVQVLQTGSCGTKRTLPGTKTSGCEAELSATILENTIIVSYDNDYGCYYNNCTYDVSVSNSGSVSGIVWKRVVSGASSFEEIYNQMVNPGVTVDLGQGWGKSDCDVSYSYNVNIYDDGGNNIGGKSFTCYHP